MPRQRAITFLCIVLAGGTSLLAQSNTTAGASPLDSLFLLQHTKTLRVSSWDRSGGNNDFVSVAPGQTRTLAEISGTGVIRRIFFGVSAPDRMKLRKLVLRMYWDGHREPCVEVPLGDFFGSGLGTLRRFHSATVDVNPGFSILDFDGMVTYLPMPFGRGARVTVENDGGLRDVFLGTTSTTSNIAMAHSQQTPAACTRNGGTLITRPYAQGPRRIRRSETSRPRTRPATTMS